MIYCLKIPMTKKEYILKLLTALDGKWTMARWLKLLIEGNVLDDTMIDSLQHIFAEAIKQSNNQQSKDSLLKSQQFLKKLQTIESEQQEKDEEDLNQLLQNI